MQCCVDFLRRCGEPAYEHVVMVTAVNCRSVGAFFDCNRAYYFLHTSRIRILRIIWKIRTYSILGTLSLREKFITRMCENWHYIFHYIFLLHYYFKNVVLCYFPSPYYLTFTRGRKQYAHYKTHEKRCEVKKLA